MDLYLGNVLQLWIGWQTPSSQ